jgi:hypothetical protein
MWSYYWCSTFAVKIMVKEFSRELGGIGIGWYTSAGMC